MRAHLPNKAAGPPPPKGGKGFNPFANGAAREAEEEEDDVIMMVPPPKNAFDNYVPPPPKPLGVKMPPQVKGQDGAKDAGKAPPALPAKPPPALSKNQQ